MTSAVRPVLHLVEVIDHDPVAGVARWHALACRCRGDVARCDLAIAQLVKLGLTAQVAAGNREER